MSLFYGLFGGDNHPGGSEAIARATLDAPIDMVHPYFSLNCGGTECWVKNPLAERAVSRDDMAFEVPVPAENLPPGSVPGATTIGELSPAPDFVQVVASLQVLEFHGWQRDESLTCDVVGGFEVCGPWHWDGPAAVNVEALAGVSTDGRFLDTSSGATFPGGISRLGADPDPDAHSLAGGNPPHDYTLGAEGMFVPDTGAYVPDTSTWQGTIDAGNPDLSTLWAYEDFASIRFTASGTYSSILPTPFAGIYHPQNAGIANALFVGIVPYWRIGTTVPGDQLTQVVWVGWDG